MTDPNAATATRPRLRQIAEFPLAAMLIACAWLVGTTLVVGNAVKQLPLGPTPAIREMVGGLILVAISIAVYKMAIRKLGERPRDDLRRDHALRDLVLGLGGGVLLFSLVTAVAAIIGVYDIVGLGDARSILFVAVTFAIVPGVMEELLFRAILFRHLEDFGGSWFALALTSALFGGAHYLNPNATAFSSVAIAVEAGLLLGGAYLLTRALWAPIGLHAAWNFTQSQLFDVPVSGFDGTGLIEARLSGPELLSGGAFGLEASVIALLIVGGAGAWLVARAVRAGHVVAPWWVRRRRERIDPAG